jgi:hypothetical protein
MAVIHFFENSVCILSQLVKTIPAVNDNIKIKGRKGKVLNVIEKDANNFYVYVELDPLLAKKALVNDPKKKKR